MNVTTMLRNLRPLTKPEHGVFSLPPRWKASLTKVRDEFISRHGPETLTASVVKMRYLRDV